MREAIQKAFDEVGGEKYLAYVAKKRPAVFCALLSKILPLQVNGSLTMSRFSLEEHANRPETIAAMNRIMEDVARVARVNELMESCRTMLAPPVDGSAQFPQPGASGEVTAEKTP